MVGAAVWRPNGRSFGTEGRPGRLPAPGDLLASQPASQHPARRCLLTEWRAGDRRRGPAPLPHRLCSPRPSGPSGYGRPTGAPQGRTSQSCSTNLETGGQIQTPSDLFYIGGRPNDWTSGVYTITRAMSPVGAGWVESLSHGR